MCVDIVKDGQQGASRRPPCGDDNVVFMDCRMPVMGGMETTRRIRADPSRQLVLIVALTARTARTARTGADPACAQRPIR